MYMRFDEEEEDGAFVENARVFTVASPLNVKTLSSNVVDVMFSDLPFNVSVASSSEAEYFLAETIIVVAFACPFSDNLSVTAPSALLLPMRIQVFSSGVLPP